MMGVVKAKYGNLYIFKKYGFHLICIGERSEAVNCERSEQEGEEIWFTQWFPLDLHWGAKRGSEL